MEFRPGLCSACKASFRIPATFTANKAKCSKCGGAVDIGAVVSDSAGATPPPAAGSAPPVPAKAIAAPVAAAAARLAAKPEGSGALPPPAKPAAAPAKPAVAPKLPAPAARAASITPAKLSPAAKSAEAPPSKSKPAADRASRDEDDGEGKKGRRERRPPLEKKPAMSGAMIGVSLLLSALVLVGVWFMWQKTSKENAERTAASEAAKAVQLEEARKLEAERARLAELAMAAEASDEKAAGKGDVLAAEKGAEHADQAGDAAATAQAEKPAGGKAAAKPDAKSASEGFDLTTIPDFGPAEGTSDAEWKELQDLAALFMDASAGARAQRAGNTLMETPKQSFPAILNQFKKLNLEDEDGYRNADATQKLLERICHGHNVGWKYKQQEYWLQYNQKAIKKWCDLWTRASTDEAYWKQLIKADAAKPDEAGAPADGATPPKKIDDF